MTAYTSLAPLEHLVDRPFTDPAHAARDAAHLRAIAGCLRHAVAGLAPAATAERPVILRHHEPDGRACRVVVCDAAALHRQAALGVVGFFGQRRADAAPTMMDRLDEDLLEEFLQHPHIVAYCSQELPDTNWGNLVLFNHPSAKEQWNGSERHAYAAKVVAPTYYASVRIHNGELPGGLAAGADLLLLRTKYYDYQSTPAWRGWREQSPPQPFAFK